jgi:hypothetical protein
MGGQFRDAALGRRQPARARRATADPGELGGGLGRPQARTKPVEQLQRLLKRLTGGRFCLPRRRTTPSASRV